MSSQLLSNLKDRLQPHGLELYLFKLQWYNEKVGKQFRLSYADDTVCAVVLSTPSFFEKAFIPFLQNEAQPQVSNTRDPVDRCISMIIKDAVGDLAVDTSADILFDYDMHPNRRPKVLVQTAGHVAGAAFYYQRQHVMHNSDAPNDGISESDPWGPGKNIYGISIHPNYGGWFAIRSVIVFPSLQDPELPYQPPPDVVPDRETRIELLNRLNGNWQNWAYRDIIPVEQKYSENQRLYFSTLPKNRRTVVEEILNSLEQSSLNRC